MTRAEMIARMSSQELSGWLALAVVQGEEAQDHRDRLDSGDGNLIVSGRDEGDDDDDGGR